MRQPHRHATALCVLASAALLLAACQRDLPQPARWTTGVAHSADGVSISYQMAGTGPVSVVFVHGWLGDRTYWRHQLDEFAREHRVVALDLAGHGASGANRDDWTYRAFGQDVAAVVTSLKLTRVILIGHSMGGPVVVEAARLLADNVIGIVGADALHNPDAPGVSNADIEAFLAPFQKDFPGAVRALVERAMFVPGSNAAVRAWIVDDMASAPQAPGIGALRANTLWATTTRADALAALRAPVRLINADLFPTDAAAIGRYGMQVVIMPGAGHFVMLEDPATFNALLRSAIADFAR